LFGCEAPHGEIYNSSLELHLKNVKWDNDGIPWEYHDDGMLLLILMGIFFVVPQVKSSNFSSQLPALQQVQSQLTECPHCSTGVTQLEMDAHLLQCKAAMLGTEDGSQTCAAAQRWEFLSWHIMA